MPTSCVAYGCVNRGKKEGITYHGFPKDVELRAKWIEAMDRPNWEPAPHSRLCSQHFQESAIDRTSLSCVRIREGAVPSIFNGVVKTVKSPVKRTTVPATPFKKLTLKEALEKREEIERELSLMNKEQNRIRKDRKTLLQVRRRKASKLEASKKLFSKISLSGQKEHYLFSLAESKRKLNKIDGELAISQEKKDKFMKRMISLKKEINYLSRIIIDYNSDIYTQVPSGEAGPSKKRVSAAASRGRSSISGEKKRKMGRKQMLKSSHDNDNESGAEDDPQQKDPFEMIDIVETTIKEEILYPEDSDDALMLQSGALQTKLQLKASEDAVPDDTAAVQELLTSLFTAVYNHQDEEGRCFSDSMQELPEHDEVEGKKLRALSLDLIKRRLDGGQYRGLDQFQEDLFSCMDRARKLSRTDSQVFEDSVELQSYFIRQRDELCLNGDLLHSPALNFTLLDLSAAVDLTRQQKLLQEQPEEEEQTRSSEDNTSRDGSSHGGLAVKVADNALSFNQQVCRIGDFVYAEPKERGMDPILLNIQRLWTNKEGQQMLYGNQYYRPRETYHVTTRKFLEKEVFKTDQHVAIPLNQVLGRCCVLSVKDFFRSRPDNFDEKDVYVCESQYSSKARVFRKIKNWPQSLTAGYKLLPREEALEPKRVMYVFRERVEKHKEEIAELEEREKLAEKEKPDPFEMIDIFERTIKEEILDPEDSDKMSNINILPDDKIFPDSSNFETVYCTPDPIKMEYEDGEPTNTETAVPECLPRIKQEPRDEFEEPEIEETQGGAKLMWRCPIVTCPEMFSAEVEMYHHYNLNHAVKGPALPSKSKKMPVSSPLITTGLLLFATPVPSNSSGPITTTTASLVTTVVSSTTSSVPVVSSSSGPVVVTTTVTTTCAPLVTTSVSSAMLVSCVPVVSTTAPVTSPSLSVPAMQSAVPDDATSTPTTASTEVPSARVCETGSSNVGTYFLVSPPAKLSSHARQNINLTKINAQDSDVSAVKPANLSKKKHKDLANSSGAHIFNPTEPTLDDLPPCATDDTEMFSISLARFPQNRRVPIKRKLINVVDCIKQKNISADNILIAYYENSCDSRTM